MATTIMLILKHFNSAAFLSKLTMIPCGLFSTILFVGFGFVLESLIGDLNKISLVSYFKGKKKHSCKRITSSKGYNHCSIATFLCLLLTSTAFIKCNPFLLYDLMNRNEVYEFKTPDAKTYYIVQLGIPHCHMYQEQVSENKECFLYLSSNGLVMELDKESHRSLQNGDISWKSVTVIRHLNYLLYNVRIIHLPYLNSLDRSRFELLPTNDKESFLSSQQMEKLVSDFTSNMETFLIGHKKMLFIAESDFALRNSALFDGQMIYEFHGFELNNYLESQTNVQIKQQAIAIDELNDQIAFKNSLYDELNESTAKIISNLTDRVQNLSSLVDSNEILIQEMTKQKKYIVIAFCSSIFAAILIITIGLLVAYYLYFRHILNEDSVESQDLRGNSQRNAQQQLANMNRNRCTPVYVQGNPSNLNRDENQPAENLNGAML